MLKKLFVICFVVSAVLSCKTVPVTGRQQLILIPSSEIMAMSYSQYSQFLNENKVLRGTKDAVMIQQMGQRIQKSVEEYMAERGLSSQLRGFEWEFNLVDDPTVNAWCMPGGKVVFYTGILPVTQNENATAIVMGHEIAHAVANHGAERMSQGLLAQGINVAVNVATMEKSPMLQQLFNTSFGVGSTLGILAFSRRHESEADEMGLFFAAMAGYDPREAPAFWQRMSQLSGGGAPPEFLSTHPSHGRRISDLNALMPKAMEYYERSQSR